MRSLFHATASLAAATALALASIPAAHAGGRRITPDVRQVVMTRVGHTGAPGVMVLSLAVHVTRVGTDADHALRAFRHAVVAANAVLVPHGISVRVESVDTVAVGGRVVSILDRRRLARYAGSGRTIHVFLVRDLDRPSARSRRPRVRGLYWQPNGLGWIRGRRLIMVTTDALPTTLSHELGHLLGLPHTSGPHNVMCGDRFGVTAFTPAQGRVMRTNARRRFVRSRYRENTSSR